MSPISRINHFLYRQLDFISLMNMRFLNCCNLAVHAIIFAPGTRYLFCTVIFQMPCAFRIILVFDILDLLQLIFNSLTHLVICFWLPNDDTYCRYAHKCECTQCCIHLYVKMNIYPFFFHKCVAVHFDESTTAYEKSAHALFVLSRGSGISQLESF